MADTFLSVTRTTLRTRLQSALGYSGTLSSAEQTIWNEQIDYAIQEVETSFRFAFTSAVVDYTTTANVAYVVLNENFIAPTSNEYAIILDDLTMCIGRIVSDDDFMKRPDIENTETGVPLWARLTWDSTTRRFRLYMKDIPGKAYTLRLNSQVANPQMSEDSATLPTPRELFELVFFGAKYRIAQIKARKDWRNFESDYDRRLKKLVNTLGDRDKHGGGEFYDPML
jgi:hypothetical protein